MSFASMFARAWDFAFDRIANYQSDERDQRYRSVMSSLGANALYEQAMKERAALGLMPIDFAEWVTDGLSAIVAIKAELMRAGYDVSGSLTNTVTAVRAACEAAERRRG